MSRQQRGDLGVDDVAEQWNVEGVIGGLADGDAIAPPLELRAAVLGRSSSRPRAATESMDPVDLYAARVAVLYETLTGLTDVAWTAVVPTYGWTVHGLVGHLLAVEHYTGHLFGVREAPADLLARADDHLAFGEHVIAEQLLRPPLDTVREWLASAECILEEARVHPEGADQPAPLHGWPFNRSAALIARAFELWTHTEDVLAAIGSSTPALRASLGVTPTPSELRTMSGALVSALPFLLRTSGSDQRLVPTRIVLTGAGGGTYDLGGPGERAALLVADVVDYCRMAARRIDPAALEHEREGDEGLIDALLEASQLIAV